MHQLSRTIQVLALFSLSVLILYFASPILIPLTFGLVLAMLLIPICRWLEGKGINRGIATGMSMLLLIALVAGLVLLMQWQVGDMIKDLSKIGAQVQKVLDKAQGFINNKFGISEKDQEEIFKDQQSGGMEKAAGIAVTTLSSFSGFFVNIVLVLVYTLLLTYFRSHFKTFVLKLVKPEDQPNAETIMHKAGKVTQQYISGLGLMIVCLWVMYGIGFSIVGIKGAIFFAILCGVLEIVPFIGNITGTAITVLVAIAQGGNTDMAVGVLITYAIVQLSQTYILEPLVVGKQVNINPLFTILIIVVGETIWGIAGMVLAIPLLGMFKVVCDNIESLKPYGYLIGSQQKE